ncbi:MAG: PepSY domain-containing protein [Gammaproteobacteria bacterium]|jgi:uncharacterized membrane protein YkoI
MWHYLRVRIVCIALSMVAGNPVPVLADEEATVAGHEEAYWLRRTGKILPLDHFIRHAQKLYPGQVLEAELERKRGRLVYEIVIADRDGRYHEIYYDAANGRLLRAEQE